MNSRDQIRLKVLLDLEGDRMTCGEAASALGVTERQVRTLRSRLREGGAAALVHGNRGRRPANACDASALRQVSELWHAKYAGFNQVHFTELLEREEGLSFSRSTVRRMLAARGIPAARPQKRSRHRRHRQRRAQAGAMVQMDGSTHDWLEGRGPRLTLVGGIDDATSRAWAVFRPAEDTAGYLELLNQIVLDAGVPASVYLDRTTIVLGTKRTPERIATNTTHYATQMTKVLQRLDIALIRARSPQAKGRIERLWRTLQDRLVCELRAKGVHTLPGAQQVLRDHLSFHNRNFEVEPLTAQPAWRPLPADLVLADAIAWIYSRVVANDNTVSVEGTKLQLILPRPDPGWARRRITVGRRLDGSWFAASLGSTIPAEPIALPQPTTRAA